MNNNAIIAVVVMVLVLLGGWYWMAHEPAPQPAYQTPTQPTDQTAGEPATTSVQVDPTAPVVGEGSHCGGFIQHAPVCAAGFHCQLMVNRPDTGGTCIKD